MVKLLDAEVKTTKLIFWIFIGLLLSLLSLTALYLFPGLIIDYVRSAIPNTQIQNIVLQLFDTRIFTLGIIISALVFTTIILRKTKVEGFLLILLGATLFSYSFILFQGGKLDILIPTTDIQEVFGVNTPINIRADISLNITTLMLTTMFTPLLIIIKGTLLTFSRLEKSRIKN